MSRSERMAEIRQLMESVDEATEDLISHAVLTLFLVKKMDSPEAENAFLDDLDMILCDARTAIEQQMEEIRDLNRELEV